MERIKSEIKNLIDEWRWHCSAEAKYRCEAYGELLDFINSLQEEPMSEDLEEAAKKAGQKYFPDKDNIWARPNYEAMAAANAFKEGAEWQKEQFEKNRLEHCDSITEEQYNLECGFIDQHIKKYHRIPTILDAIESGMKKQMEITYESI